MESAHDMARILDSSLPPPSYNEESASTATTTSNNVENEAHLRFMSESRVWVTLWIFCFILFVIYPVICHDTNRRRCIWRLIRCSWRCIYRRWDVSDIEDRIRNDDRHHFMRNVMPSHSIYGNNDSSNNNDINDNDDWQNKQILILEKLADYTITLTKDDFIGIISSIEDDDIESQQSNNENNENNSKNSILIPQPGELATSERTNVISEECSICLGSYKVGDRICYSSNDTCPHVYHEQCIIQWLVALLTKQKRDVLRRNRRNRNTINDGINNNDSNENNNEVEVGESSPSSEIQNINNTDIATEPTPQSQSPSSSNIVSNNPHTLKLCSLPRACPMCRRNFIVEKSGSCENVNADEDDKFDSSSLSIITDDDDSSNDLGS